MKLGLIYDQYEKIYIYKNMWQNYQCEHRESSQLAEISPMITRQLFRKKKKKKKKKN